MAEEEVDLLSETNTVHRRGAVVLRKAGPHSAMVHSLLRYLEDAGFKGAPRVVGDGFDPQGRETLTYIDGDFMHPSQRSPEAIATLGALLRNLHTATAKYTPPPDALWRPWFVRSLGGSHRLISHCDPAPWNVCLKEGLPFALIDWDLAGPVDPLMELAQAAWLNVGLYSDDIPEREHLPPLVERVVMLRAIVDGYELPRQQRRGFFDQVVSFAVHATAAAADEHAVSRETRGSPALWAMAWQARSAAWMLRNREPFERALQ